MQCRKHAIMASQPQPLVAGTTSSSAMAETNDNVHQLHPLQDGCFTPLPHDVQHAVLKHLSSDSLGALLATNKHCHQLVKGFISSIKITKRQDIVALSSWPHVRRLDLSCARLNVEDFSFLVCGPLLSLQHLDLSKNKLGSEAAEQLVSASLPSLTSLNLAYTVSPWHWPTGSEECQAVCHHLAAGAWPKLRVLDLSHNSFSSHAWTELVKGCWPGLLTLDVKHCLVDDADASIQHLAAANWHCLTQLSLSYFYKGDPLHSLAAASWSQLTKLTIQPYCSKDLTVLTQAKSVWHTLRHLTLNCGNGTIQEVLALVQSPGQALEALYVDCGVADAVQAAPTVDSWPGDTRLHVAASLCPLGLQSFAAGYWPIEALQIAVRDFDQGVVAAGVEQLAHLRLSSMKSFACEVHTVANLQAILQTVCLGITQASWPALQRFLLRSPCVTDIHLMQLTAGKWPMLETFDVSAGQVSVPGTLRLINGSWPLLKSVSLPILYVDPLTRFGRSPEGLRASCQALFARWPSLKLCSTTPP